MCGMSETGCGAAGLLKRPAFGYDTSIPFILAIAKRCSIWLFHQHSFILAITSAFLSFGDRTAQFHLAIKRYP
ncbi:hypothetical protein CBW46_004480 [Paenibacillus xerothermodurans]|uniref:Uncharacterized protein n=1 Tax=Paenibacillus xerothermodurans TaxID=1977292 RepID=A0A2W1P1P6_PAEXE|nr:hypothetical protein CBW46_004480 [Paenibacillus xerothermodurans]